MNCVKPSRKTLRFIIFFFQAEDGIRDLTVTGVQTCALPISYGLWNNDTLKLLRKYRMLMIMWTVDTEDYRLPGIQSIVHTAVSGARPGAIILMHDAGGNRSETVSALPIVIRDLRARGYKLVTVPKLLLDNPPPADQQISAILGSGG